jgi:hypothetical protein
MTALGMSWGAARQRIFCGEESFEHEGPIHTDPSHDCAHVLIAACSRLPWRPVGDRETVKLAEYNASVLEHLLDLVYSCGCLRSVRLDNVLTAAKWYANWFVTTHYAPFPVPAADALRILCGGLDVDAVVRLSPHFFTLKRDERGDMPRVRGRQIEIAFERDDKPVADEASVRLQGILHGQLRQLIAGAP